MYSRQSMACSADADHSRRAANTKTLMLRSHRLPRADSPVLRSQDREVTSIDDLTVPYSKDSVILREAEIDIMASYPSLLKVWVAILFFRPSNSNDIRSNLLPLNITSVLQS
jgi:hypothetical protein